jgi:hypothetical protein
MKKILVLAVLLLSCFLAFPQVDDKIPPENVRKDEIKTLFPRGKGCSVGGYGELSMLYSQIDNRDAFTFGARAGVIMGHMITIGFCGSGFFNDPSSNFLDSLERGSITGGYGGIFFEPILFPKFPVHLSIPVTVGVGGVTFARINDLEEDFEDTYNVEETDAYFVIEPGVEIELNITKFFRLSIGGYYRYTTDVDMKIGETTVPSDLLKGFSGGINLKFGKF